MKAKILIGEAAEPAVHLESDMPRYVQASTYADGTPYFRYNPPQEFVDAGVVRRGVLQGERLQAFQLADEYNNAIDEYRHKQTMHQDKGHDPSVRGLADMYCESTFFDALRPITQDQYSYFIQKLCDTELDGIAFGDRNFKDVTNGMAQRMYEQVLKTSRTKGGDGVQMANHVLSIAKRIWSVGNKWEVVHRNPWKFVEKLTPKRRKLKWTNEQIKTLLETSFAKFEWRSVGVMILLAYETSQRATDLRELKWDNIRFDTKEFVLEEQSKRGAEVAIPLADNVMDVLDQQMQDFGDQNYVAPHPKMRQPYTLMLLSKTFQRIRDTAGLPKELQMRDIRRTVISELADNGATQAEIMSWSGHMNPNSLKPYLQTGKAAAKAAFSKRRNTVD